MKKLYIVLSLAGMMAATNLYAGFDGTVTVNYGPYNGNGGGEFTANSSGLGNFLTFCIEDNEYFNPGGTYSYIENTGAVLGGVSGQHATDPNTGLSMDNISIGTAWLYSQFRAGSIPVASTGQAEDLQLAIWFLEGEKTSVDLTAGAITLLGDAETGTGKSDYTGLEADSGGAYGVIALNLYSTSPVSGAPVNETATIDGQTYYVVQDQLAVVPESTTVIAGALLLLPFGVSTLRILRRNRMA
jgi:hypothetical protein